MNSLRKDSKIYIAGHNGMVGSACIKTLKDSGYLNLIGKSSKELDLRNQSEVEDFIAQEKPIAIIDAAAKVGGIMANDTQPYEFLMDNMLIQNNLIRASHNLNVEKFIFLGSSCIYPKHAPQPLKEKYLLSGPLEPTNEYYAIAKITGIKLIESLKKKHGRNYVSLMPTNLYGPNDNFDLNSSHVIPALINKFHNAKINSDPRVVLWGTGTPLREFLHVDDLSNAVKFFLENDVSDFIYNVGSGKEHSINEIANIIKSIVKCKSEIIWDNSMPDGTPRKLMDSDQMLKFGWEPSISLNEGITSTYKWFLNNKN